MSAENVAAWKLSTSSQVQEMRLPKCVRVNINDRGGAENLILDGWHQVETMENWVGQRPDDYEEQLAKETPSIFTVEEASADHAAAVSMLPVNHHNRLFAEPNMDPHAYHLLRGHCIRWRESCCRVAFFICSPES